MTLQEALKQLMPDGVGWNGSSVRRPSHPDHKIKLLLGIGASMVAEYQYYPDKHECWSGWYPYRFTVEDILAEDWEMQYD